MTYFDVPEEKAITAYKGMHVANDGSMYSMYCQPVQSRGPHFYDVGKSYHESYVRLCVSGYHCCLLIADVLDYHPNIRLSAYAEVKIWGKLDVGDDKIAAEYIHIVKRVNPFDVHAQQNALFDRYSAILSS